MTATILPRTSVFYWPSKNMNRVERNFVDTCQASHGEICRSIRVNSIDFLTVFGPSLIYYTAVYNNIYFDDLS